MFNRLLELMWTVVPEKSGVKKCSSAEKFCTHEILISEILRRSSWYHSDQQLMDNEVFFRWLKDGTSSIIWRSYRQARNVKWNDRPNFWCHSWRRRSVTHWGLQFFRGRCNRNKPTPHLWHVTVILKHFLSAAPNRKSRKLCNPKSTSSYSAFHLNNQLT